MTGTGEPGAPGPSDVSLGTLLRQEGWPMLWAALAAAAVPLALYLLAKAMNLPGSYAVISSLAGAIVWVALACPVLAAGPDGGFPALLRAACAVDGTLVTLIVLWACEPTATLAGIAKAYCTLAALALVGMAAARCGRRQAGRYAAAVVAAVVLTGLLAAPFAVGGMVQAMDNETARHMLTWLYHANPFVSVTMALRAETNIVWPTTGWLYWVCDSGGYPAPRTTPWYAATAIYLAAGAVLAGVARLLRTRASGRP